MNHFLFIHLCKLIKSTLKRVIWWSSVDLRLSTLKASIIQVKQMECCKSAPTVFDFATSLYQLIRCHTRHTNLFNKINTFTVQVGCMRNEAIWIDNQYMDFDNLPLDSSRQVGDQFLISGSPQTRFGRIGEWASGNLQPWALQSGFYNTGWSLIMRSLQDNEVQYREH